MARKRKKNVAEPIHEISGVSLTRIWCLCGKWFWRNDNLRRPDGSQKSDEELAAETQAEFDKHKAVHKRE